MIFSPLQTNYQPFEIVREISRFQQVRNGCQFTFTNIDGYFDNRSKIKWNKKDEYKIINNLKFSFKNIE